MRTPQKRKTQKIKRKTACGAVGVCRFLGVRKQGGIGGGESRFRPFEEDRKLRFARLGQASTVPPVVRRFVGRGSVQERGGVRQPSGGGEVRVGGGLVIWEVET